MLDFIKTGKFGSIELGQTIEYIKANFPLPDDIWDGGDDTFIWRYGVFEFHFIQGELALLWCDNLAYLNNPDKEQFVLDKWIFKESEELTLSYFCSILDLENIAYNVKGTFFDYQNQKLPDNVILNVDDTDVVVYFENVSVDASSISSYTLVAIGASKFKQQNNVYSL